MTPTCRDTCGPCGFFTVSDRNVLIFSAIFFVLFWVWILRDEFKK